MVAVYLENRTRRYIGVSSDTKPIVGSQLDGSTVADNDLPPGSSFLEQDTGRIYHWSGKEWTYRSQDDTATATDMLAVLMELLLEVRELRQRVALVTA